MTLKEFLEKVSNLIKKNYAFRIYSIQNHSVVGTILHQKELIPENVYNYKFISMDIEPRFWPEKGIPDMIIVVTVE